MAILKVVKETQICPHCGVDAVIPILYGMPTPSAMEAAERGEKLLAGCLVEGDDPQLACRHCASLWTAEHNHSTTRISQEFANYFSDDKIELPPGAEAAEARGTIHKAGWTINYRFGHDQERYLEFYATHRMTNDRRHRIYGSGRIEDLDAIREGYMYDPKVPGSEEEAKRSYLDHNQRMASELRSLGLYPEGDLNAYLRTNHVPSPGDE